MRNVAWRKVPLEMQHGTSALQSSSDKIIVSMTARHRYQSKVVGDAWKHVVLSHLTKLEEMEEAGDASVQERTRAAVEKVAVAKGYVTDGVLCMPGTFRNFRVAKPAVV